MKTKRMIVTVLVLFCLAVAGAGQAMAAAAVYVCEVVRAGVNNDTGKTEIVLKPTTTMRTFVAPAGQEKEMLAIALTAMSTGIKVRAKINWATANSDILQLQLAGDAQ